MGESSHAMPPVEKTPEKWLDSWKAIAAYLNRDVTTVQRWEKREGMPVHRHVHAKRGSVYALPEELDNWIQSRSGRSVQTVEKSEAENSVAAPDAPGKTPSLSRRAWVLSTAAALCFGIAAIAVWFVVWHRITFPAESKVRSLAVLPLRDLLGRTGAAVPGRRRHRSPHCASFHHSQSTCDLAHIREPF